MGGVLDKWFGIDPPKIPEMPKPLPPASKDVSGTVDYTKARAKQRKGLRSTIKASGQKLGNTRAQTTVLG